MENCIVMKDTQTQKYVSNGHKFFLFFLFRCILAIKALFLCCRSRGFGFVTFVDSTCVDEVQRSRPHIIDDKTVDTKRVIPKSVSIYNIL